MSFSDNAPTCTTKFGFVTTGVRGRWLRRTMREYFRGMRSWTEPTYDPVSGEITGIAYCDEWTFRKTKRTFRVAIASVTP
jgi:hypothetical protein